MFVPTTKVTVLKESKGTDEYGDPTDEYRATKRGVPAHIYQTESVAADPALGRPTVVKRYKALLKDALVEKGFRLKDEETGLYYIVHDITLFVNFIGTRHVEVELKRVDN